MARKKRRSRGKRGVKGGRHNTIYNNRERVYESLKRRYGNPKAARIANAGNTKAKRSRMARKAARTRKRRGH